MKAFEYFNGCKVYNLSSGKTMPEWLSTAKKRALQKDEEYRKRLELIQDFEMSTSSQCLKMTNDGQHIILTGVYPPIVRCFTTTDLAMKFQRGLTCEVVAMETLSDDFGKLVFLQADRTLNFHAPYGTHYSLRVPKFGRDLLYNPCDCDLYVAASGDELYRLNLERGQFREPFSLSFSGCNTMHLNPAHQLLACGGDQGICEFWDPRARVAAARITTQSTLLSPGLAATAAQDDIIGRRIQQPGDITQLKFDSDGLTLGIGMHGGQCNFYDIRSQKPFYIKEHPYGLPIVDITFHNSSRNIITTDKKVVKIWSRDEPEMGKIMTNIETPADINSLLLVKDQRGPTGLLMMAGEQTRVMTYFVPQLGPAPRWCSFLESLTEELEETAGSSVYDDFKFLTRKEVEELGASGLVGTPMLKSYMHGFFMEMKLYHKLRAVSKPFEYEEHRKRKIQEKIEAKRQSRITAVKRLPKVNAALAEKLMGRGGSGSTAAEAVTVSAAGGKAKRAGGDAIIDERFASLFEREEFQQDEESEAFKLRNPVRSTKQQEDADMQRAGYDSEDDDLADAAAATADRQMKASAAVVASDEYDDDDEDSDDEDVEGDDIDAVDDDDQDNDYIEKVSASRQQAVAAGSKRKARKPSSAGGDGSDDDDDGQIAKVSRKLLEKRQRLQQQWGMPALNNSFARGNVRGLAAGGRGGRGAASAARGQRTPRMYTLADGIGGSAGGVFGQSDEKKEQRVQQKTLVNVPLADRLQQQEQLQQQQQQKQRFGRSNGFSKGSKGSAREFTYMPAGSGGNSRGNSRDGRRRMK